jgi:hypothetical protein
MMTDDHTAEDFCRSLGLSGFAEDSQLAVPGEVLRLLLRPSFHPGLCITISGKESHAEISVAAARDMHIRQLAIGPDFVDRDHGATSAESFADLVASLSAIHSADKAPIVLDGMPVNVLLRRDGVPELSVRGNPTPDSALCLLAAQAISQAWAGIQGIPCKNALARAGRYVGVDLPSLTEPEQKQATQILVLGPEEDRQQLLQALRQSYEGSSPIPHSTLPFLESIKCDYMQIREVDGSSADVVTLRYGICTEEQARQIAELWSALREAEQARCHIPGFAIDLIENGAVIFSSSICWTCNNIRMSGKLCTSEWATFDRDSGAAQALLGLCKLVVRAN